MIEFFQVCKNYGGQDVLVDVSFRVSPGARVGVVGPNGAGKSTLFALITGEVSPDKGRVTCRKGARLGYVRQMVVPQSDDQALIAYVELAVPELHDLEREIHELDHRLHAGLEVDQGPALRRLGELQTRFEHMGGYVMRNKAEAALSGLGFSVEDFERPFASFSGGWQMRAELARVIVADPEILLLDEPSNYLDIPAVEWLQKSLRDFKGTLILISHDRFLLNTLTDDTIEIFAGKATRYAGNYDYYAAERVRRRETMLGAYKNQERQRQQLERFVERFKAKNTKASQAASKQKQLDRMDSIAVPAELVSPGRIRLAKPPHCGLEVVRLENAGFSYDRQRWVLRGVDLGVARGDKLVLIGLNGMGKTTLLRLIAGQLQLGEGRRVMGHQVLVGYQSQEFAETLDPARTVYETLKNAAPDLPESSARSLLGGFGFSGDAVEKKVGVLSGGEKIRMAFARLLAKPPNLLILDEPTTHLDITAREALEQALREFEGTVVMVSHDIEFVRHTGARVIAMTPPGITPYAGDYDYYHEKMTAKAGQAVRGDSSASLAGDDRRAKRRDRAETIQRFGKVRRELERQVKAAEEGIAKLEREQAEWVGKLSDPANTDYLRTNHRLYEIQIELAKAAEKWEKASRELEQTQKDFESATAGS
jgi:ATP-binding cassette subfamily F protein 3